MPGFVSLGKLRSLEERKELLFLRKTDCRAAKLLREGRLGLAVAAVTEPGKVQTAQPEKGRFPSSLRRMETAGP